MSDELSGVVYCSGHGFPVNLAIWPQGIGTHWDKPHDTPSAMPRYAYPLGHDWAAKGGLFILQQFFDDDALEEIMYNGSTGPSLSVIVRMACVMWTMFCL